MRYFKPILLASALYSLTALAGCAQPMTQAHWNNDVAALQVGAPILEADLNKTPEGKLPAVVKAEAQVNLDIAALTGTPAPSSAQAIIADLQALDDALDASTASAAHKDEIGAMLAIAELMVAHGQAAAGPMTMTPSAPVAAVPAATKPVS